MTKSQLRLEIKDRLSSLTEAYLEGAGRKIEEKAISSSVFKNSKNIFIYVSVKNEPPTENIILESLRQGKNVFVPKCLGEGVMKAVRIESIDDLSPGMLSIPEPRDDSKTYGAENIDLVIVPCVSASKNMKRLGHGGGYYDRFLEKSKAYKLCLCYEKIICGDIVTDENDILMDFVLTEETEI